MSQLNVTLIDVGWGDSILLEWQSNEGESLYGLIDSNDTAHLQSSYIFLRRFFEKKGLDPAKSKPLFEFVMLSHAHADHGQGLAAVLKQFGAKNFWYPKSENPGLLAALMRFASRSTSVYHHQAIDATKIIPDLGDAKLKVLWPEYNVINTNENNNSIVLLASLGSVSFLLSGDAEGPVWDSIAHKIPSDTHFLKVPHHGSRNGFFSSGGTTPWLDNCPDCVQLGISSHVRPFKHPDTEVVEEIANRGYVCYRTDEHYHITVSTDGVDAKVKYSH